MIHHSETISHQQPPQLGDTVIIKQQSYWVSASALGYYLADSTGKKNIQVGVHKSIRTLVEGIISQNTWNTHLSRQRTRDLARA